jgi:hypothetical protein
LICLEGIGKILYNKSRPEKSSQNRVNKDFNKIHIIVVKYKFLYLGSKTKYPIIIGRTARSGELVLICKAAACSVFPQNNYGLEIY